MVTIRRFEEGLVDARLLEGGSDPGVHLFRSLDAAVIANAQASAEAAKRLVVS